MIDKGTHVAFKCTYNNGDEGFYVGFLGTCSDNIIKRNIEGGRIWCNQEENLCKQYYDKHFSSRRPVAHCYESELFRDWKFGSGQYHTGKRAGKPIHARKIGLGKIAIMTTRFPGDNEIDRKIIGLFKIIDIQSSDEQETTVFADEEFRIRLPLEEAKELYFWKYYSTKGEVMWGSLLFRYLRDDQVNQILSDIEKTIQNRKVKEKIRTLREDLFSSTDPLPPSGPRYEKSRDRTNRVLIKRKYGPGGEGRNHRELKEWIAENPEELGIPDVINSETEYGFVSGDRVDILFERKENKFTVVEIETDKPYPGCHQALKYKILKCAESGFEITSENVTAAIVAWTIPEECREFCERYKINYYEKKRIN